MLEFIYLPIILLLYFRTWEYKQLIDDAVPRDGMMYTIVDTKIKDLSFYKKQRPIMATVTNIGVFMAVCGYIHYFFGWKVALLYAVFPLNVNGVAWSTGNYYMSSVLLLAGALLYKTMHCTMPLELARMALEATFYAAAMNSTLSSIPYLIASCTPFNFLSFVTFMFGKRMRTGLSARMKVHDKIGLKTGIITLETIKNIPKTLSYYIFLSFWPSRLGLFHQFGKEKIWRSNGGLLLSSLLVVLFILLGVCLNVKAIFFWFLFLGIFSQFIIFGQYTAERYTFISNVFFCMLINNYVQLMNIHWLYPILATLWFYRSHLYIKDYENNGTWMTGSARAFPKAPENYNNLGNLYMDDGRYFDAVRPLLQAEINTVGSKYNIRANLSQCYMASGMYDKALYYATLALNDPGANKEQRPALEANIKALQDKVAKIQRQQTYLKKQGII